MNQTELEIRKDLPRPPHRSKVRSPVTLAFARMQIGHSIDLALDQADKGNLYRAASYAKIRIQLRTLINGRDGALTNAVPKGKTFLRIWRSE